MILNVAKGKPGPATRPAMFQEDVKLHTGRTLGHVWSGNAHASSPPRQMISLVYPPQHTSMLCCKHKSFSSPHCVRKGDEHDVNGSLGYNTLICYRHVQDVHVTFMHTQHPLTHLLKVSSSGGGSISKGYNLCWRDKFWGPIFSFAFASPFRRSVAALGKKKTWNTNHRIEMALSVEACVSVC